MRRRLEVYPAPAVVGRLVPVLPGSYRSKEEKGKKMAEVTSKGSAWTTIKSHALTGISYLIPVVVGGGFLMAIGSICGGSALENNSFLGMPAIPDALYTMGSLILGLLPVVICAAISFSIADKPGIAPGVLVGLISINMNCGFLGGFIGGYLAGYVAKFLRDKMPVPKWAEGLKPMLLIPLISGLICGLIMVFVVGVPIAALVSLIDSFVRGLDMTQAALFGLIVGILAGVDYGGPINKVVFAFLLTLQAEGINEPMAVNFLASIVTPFGFTFAYFLQKPFRKNIYTHDDVDTLKTAFPMGVCMITEGTYPIIFSDLAKSMLSTAIGGGIGGALSMIWGCGVPVAHGGLFSMPTMTNPLGWFAALMIGSMITGTIFFILRKPRDVNDSSVLTEADEADIDLADLKIS